MEKSCVKIWEFAKAPKDYRDRSWFKGEEEFVVYLPTGTAKELVDHLQWVDPSGEPQVVKVKGGTILITAEFGCNKEENV